MRENAATGGDGVEAFLSKHPAIESGASLAPGTIVGGWRATALLGRGGSAEVYRAVHTAHDIEAALKILSCEDMNARARFARETRFAMSAGDSCFPRYLDSGVYRGRPFIVEELLEPAEIPHTDTAAAKYVLAAAKCAERLHSMGFVHRDIKPRNIMRRKDGSAVLIDFGLLKEIGKNNGNSLPPPVTTMDGKAAGSGTPGYSAPEQFLGGEVSPAADIHALGVLANECFNGKPPRCWTKIIDRATSSIPERRFANVGDFMKSIRARHRLRNTAVLASIAAVLSAACALFAVRSIESGNPAPAESIEAVLRKSNASEGSATGKNRTEKEKTAQEQRDAEHEMILEMLSRDVL